MPPKSLEKLEDSVTLAELLDEYAEHLFWWLNWMRKRRRSEPIEAHVILATREDLWEAMKRRPDGLTKEQRKRLRELDALLKAHASWMVKVLGDELLKWRKRFKPPRSHWWWYLDKFVAR
ncbi:MAG: hypothetical protein N3B10_14785 [Armatimonadetes bacterium]|nr:hypothetical protein [Armatimonadota bacterium]